MPWPSQKSCPSWPSPTNIPALSRCPRTPNSWKWPAARPLAEALQARAVPRQRGRHAMPSALETLVVRLPRHARYRELDASESPLRSPRTTGTDGVKRVVPGVVERFTKGHQAAFPGTLQTAGADGADCPQPLETQAAGASQHRPAAPCTNGPAGIRTRNQGIISPTTDQRSDRVKSAIHQHCRFRLHPRLHHKAGLEPAPLSCAPGSQAAGLGRV